MGYDALLLQQMHYHMNMITHDTAFRETVGGTAGSKLVLCQSVQTGSKGTQTHIVEYISDKKGPRCSLLAESMKLCI